MKWMVRCASVLVLAALLTLPVGCGCKQKVTEKVTEKALEKAIEADAKKDGKDVDVKMDLDGGSVSIKSKDGKESVDMKSDDNSVTVKTQDGTFVSGEGAKLPDNFPKDIPVYPGAAVEAASTQAENEVFTVSMNSPDAVEKVGEFYKKELAGKGWTEEQSMNQGGDNPMQMLNYKKESRTAMVTISRESDKTTILVVTGKDM